MWRIGGLLPSIAVPSSDSCRTSHAPTIRPMAPSFRKRRDGNVGTPAWRSWLRCLVRSVGRDGTTRTRRHRLAERPRPFIALSRAIQRQGVARALSVADHLTHGQMVAEPGRQLTASEARLQSLEVLGLTGAKPTAEVCCENLDYLRHGRPGKYHQVLQRACVRSDRCAEDVQLFLRRLDQPKAIDQKPSCPRPGVLSVARGNQVDPISDLRFRPHL